MVHFSLRESLLRRFVSNSSEPLFAAHGVSVGLGRCWVGAREVCWIETAGGMVLKSRVFPQGVLVFLVFYGVLWCSQIVNAFLAYFLNAYRKLRVTDSA